MLFREKEGRWEERDPHRVWWRSGTFKVWELRMRRAGTVCCPELLRMERFLLSGE